MRMEVGVETLPLSQTGEAKLCGLRLRSGVSDRARLSSELPAFPLPTPAGPSGRDWFGNCFPLRFQRSAFSNSFRRRRLSTIPGWPYYLPGIAEHRTASKPGWPAVTSLLSPLYSTGPRILGGSPQGRLKTREIEAKVSVIRHFTSLRSFTLEEMKTGECDPEAVLRLGKWGV